MVNQYCECGPSVSTYADFLILGNALRLNSSTGTHPEKCAKSSSTTCAKRERFTTTRTVSSSCRRRNASTLALSGKRNSRVPREKALKFFRVAITRRIHQRSDDKFFC